jgi:trimeric autotransporter adhesin
MKQERVFFGLLFLLVLVTAAMQPGFAQVRSGTIVGIVADEQGGRIPGAEVALINQGTQIPVTVVTNDAGEYLVPYLAAGAYTVQVVMPGFETLRRTDVQVATAQTVRVDAVLKVGEVSNVLEVRAEAVQLQTETSTVTNAIDEKLILALPNITHNPLFFATLQPGVTARANMLDSQTASSFGVGFAGRLRFTGFSVNGGQVGHNDVQLDGLSVLGAGWHDATVLPNTEAIQEVRTIVNNYSAEYGRAEGIVQISTKPGGNEYHGNLFYRSRNEAFNANTFQNNRTWVSQQDGRTVARAPFRVHSYGATFGGPVIRDKAFFFTSWEGLYHRFGSDFYGRVPTEKELAGDWSETYRSVSGVPTLVKIFDPWTVTPMGGNIYKREQVPNNKIINPNPFVQKLFSYYPKPNREPDDIYQARNYYLRGVRKVDRNSINSRLDYATGKHSLYSSFGAQTGQLLEPRQWGEDNPFTNRAADLKDRNPYGQIGDTWAVSPTLVLDARYQLSRIESDSAARAFKDLDYDQFGIPKDKQAVNPVPGNAPQWTWSSQWPFTALDNNGYNFKQERQTHHGVVASLTKTRSRWTHRAGIEYRAMFSNYVDAVHPVLLKSEERDSAGPYVNHQGAWQSSYDPAFNTADYRGIGPAAFQMGVGVNVIREGNTVRPALKQSYMGLYTQNDWRASDRLTLNLGLRWDLQPGPTERFNRLSSLDFTRQNPFGTYPHYSFAGVDGYNRNYWNTEWDNFGPRLGFAYRITDSFVVNGGYGLTYLPSNTGFYATPGMYGMGSFAHYTDEGTSTVYGNNPAGYPIGDFTQFNPLIQPTGTDTTAPGLYGLTSADGAWRMDRHEWKSGRVQQWNLSLQKQVGRVWLVSANYVGKHGDRLHLSRVPLNTNQYISPSILADWRNTYIQSNGKTIPWNQPVPNPWQPDPDNLIRFRGDLGRTTVPLIYSLQKYPHMGVMATQLSEGFSDYHGLTLQLNRRFSNGLQFNTHYTWSKSTDLSADEIMAQGFYDTGGGGTGNYNMLNLKASKRVSFMDQPHRWLLNFVYDLPFGMGRQFATGNRALDLMIGGWQIAGTGQAQSGSPLGIGGPWGPNVLNMRPDRDWSVPVEVPKELQRWYDGKTSVALPSGRVITPPANTFLKYNSDAFKGRVVMGADGTTVLADQWYWGDAAGTFSDIRGKGYHNWNMTLMRTFQATERFAVDFIAQASNVFNKAQFRPNMNAWFGSVNTTGPIVGYTNEQNWGTHGHSTFDPRQIEVHLKVRF